MEYTISICVCSQEMMVAVTSQQSQEPSASTPYGLLCCVCAEALELWVLGNTSPSLLSAPPNVYIGGLDNILEPGSEVVCT